MSKKLIIDAETWLYMYASSCIYSGEWMDHTNPGNTSTNTWMHFFRQSEARQAFEDAVEAMQNICPDHSVLLAFGSKTNFRYSIYKNYKSNRRKTIKPAGYVEQLIPWAQSTWPSVQLDGVEADDVCGIEYEEGDVIASRDKDLLTLPGWHLRGDEISHVTEQQADHAFYTQCLTGDITDGYPGIKGCGPVKAERVLGVCTNQSQWWSAVLAAYKAAGHDADFALTQARCARILRSGEYDRANKRPHLWEPVPF